MPTRFEKRNWAARSCLLHLLSFVNGLFRPGSKLANAFQLPFLYHKFVRWALEAAAAASGTEGSVSRRAHRHQDREGEPASAAAAIHSPGPARRGQRRASPHGASGGTMETATATAAARHKLAGNQNRVALLITLRGPMSCSPQERPGGLQLQPSRCLPHGAARQRIPARPPGPDHRRRPPRPAAPLLASPDRRCGRLAVSGPRAGAAPPPAPTAPAAAARCARERRRAPLPAAAGAGTPGSAPSPSSRGPSGREFGVAAAQLRREVRDRARRRGRRNAGGARRVPVRARAAAAPCCSAGQGQGAGVGGGGGCVAAARVTGWGARRCLLYITCWVRCVYCTVRRPAASVQFAVLARRDT